METQWSDGRSTASVNSSSVWMSVLDYAWSIWCPYKHNWLLQNTLLSWVHYKALDRSEICLCPYLDYNCHPSHPLTSEMLVFFIQPLVLARGDIIITLFGLYLRMILADWLNLLSYLEYVSIMNRQLAAFKLLSETCLLWAISPSPQSWTWDMRTGRGDL